MAGRVNWVCGGESGVHKLLVVWGLASGLLWWALEEAVRLLLLVLQAPVELVALRLLMSIRVGDDEEIRVG